MPGPPDPVDAFLGRCSPRENHPRERRLLPAHARPVRAAAGRRLSRRQFARRDAQISARERVRRELDESWGRDLIRAWNTAGWIDLPATRRRQHRRPGRRAEGLGGRRRFDLDQPLQGADRRPRTSRRRARSSCPTAATSRPISMSPKASAGCWGGAMTLKIVDPEAVDRRARRARRGPDADRGRLPHGAPARHAPRSTAKAKALGAVAIWDLAHSAGALPVDLAGCGADFAVGCGYKYLNGGPGAPAFIYVAAGSAGRASRRRCPAGWAMPRRSPSSSAIGRRRAIDRLRAGTPPVLSLAALDAALDVFDGVDMPAAARALDRAQRRLHPAHRSRLPRTRARFAPRSRRARLAGLVPLRGGLRRDAGADRARRHRRLPRARRDALRLRAALYRIRRRRGGRGHARRDRARPPRGIVPNIMRGTR